MSGDVDRLYAAPPEEFVAHRNELAKALRQDGKTDEAAKVAGLRKPVAAAWVVNRLARDEREKIRALIRATESVKAGRKDADTRFREAVDALTSAARSVVDGAGRQPSETVLRDVATTLRAAAATDPELLAAGRLETTVEPSGFEAMAGATLRGPTGRSAKAAPRKDPARLVAARKELEEAKAEARRLRRAAGEAERDAERTRAAATRAESALEKAEARLARGVRRQSDT